MSSKSREHQKRDETDINNRRRQDIERPGMGQVAHPAGFQPALLTGDLFRKANPLFLDDELEFFSFLLELDFKFFLQFLDSAYEIVNRLRHSMSSPV